MDYQCDICNKNKSNLVQLWNHQKKHTKNTIYQNIAGLIKRLF